MNSEKTVGEGNKKEDMQEREIFQLESKKNSNHKILSKKLNEGWNIEFSSEDGNALFSEAIRS